MYGIFTYIFWIFPVNVAKYTSPMDPIGSNSVRIVEKQGDGFLGSSAQKSGEPKILYVYVNSKTVYIYKYIYI